METFWQRVQAIAPAPAEALLKFPRKDKADSPMEGFVIERGAPHPNARTMVFIDAYSGQTLRHKSYADSSPGHKLYFWTLSFHTGQVGGVLVQAILLVAVLTIPLLAYTGVSSYLRRRRSAFKAAADRVTTIDEPKVPAPMRSAEHS